METEKSKLLSEFERLQGISSNIFDERDWIKFDRFVERRKEKEHWIFERSSGFNGYRNIDTNEWIYENEYLEKFGEKEDKTEKLYTKEDLEMAHQQGAIFAYGRKEATRTDRLAHFEDWFNTIKR